MSGINGKIFCLFDVLILLMNEIIEGKKIDNEFEKERLRIWKSDMKHKMVFGETWPEGFEEDWE